VTNQHACSGSTNCLATSNQGLQGGLASLGIVARDLAPALIGEDPLDHAVLQDRLLHHFAKLGPEGALTGALAAVDIALWDLKGKLLQQPIYKLIGGAWRTRLPFYASIGGNGERTVDEVVRAVEARSRISRRRSRSALISIAPCSTTTYQATSRRPAPSGSSSAMPFRSPSTPTTATRSAARYGSVARSRSWATGGSRSQCSIIT